MYIKTTPIKAMHIAFLYTLSDNIPLFSPYIQRYLRDRNMTVTHHLNEELLQHAREDGLTANVAAEIHQAVTEIADTGADMIVCTCSTIGDLAEQTPAVTATVIRVDRPMARAAVAFPQIHVLAALPDTLEPTMALLRSTAKAAGREPKISTAVVPQAWQSYQAGDQRGYAATIARFIRENCQGLSGALLLAQASMAPAAQLVRGRQAGQILTSPELCLRYLASLPMVSAHKEAAHD
ncbi:hypothetical protein [Photobacterium atrarenae]|uniref:Arylsulfatase n=1 Tax=Photobacterium atrarenae TaxID=865757 RepID=A0ABY5GPE7_9GAMM|nr:hypothetical protein [Photobacterium atrarenae]UTV31006.1 hypothetical protein NNL38_24270 [Photobacterium atrarenae]